MALKPFSFPSVFVINSHLHSEHFAALGFLSMAFWISPPSLTSETLGVLVGTIFGRLYCMYVYIVYITLASG